MRLGLREATRFHGDQAAFTEGLKKITDRLDQSLESEKPKTTFLKEFPQWLKVYTLAKFSAVFIAGIHSILRPICFQYRQ